MGVVRVGYWCLKEWKRPLFSRLYETGMLILILIAPISIMTFAYSSIASELWIVSVNRASMRGNTSTGYNKFSEIYSKRKTLFKLNQSFKEPRFKNSSCLLILFTCSLSANRRNANSAKTPSVDDASQRKQVRMVRNILFASTISHTPCIVISHSLARHNNREILLFETMNAFDVKVFFLKRDRKVSWWVTQNFLS